MASKEFTVMLIQALRTLLLAAVKIIAIIVSWVLQLLGSLFLWLSALTVKLVK